MNVHPIQFILRVWMKAAQGDHSSCVVALSRLSHDNTTLILVKTIRRLYPEIRKLAHHRMPVRGKKFSTRAAPV